MREIISKGKMVDLVAAKSGYHKYEVEDIINALNIVMKEQLHDGNKIRFETLFSFHLEKPALRYIYNPHTQVNYESPCYPRIVLTVSDVYTEYLKGNPTISVYYDRNQGKRKKRERYKPTVQHALPSRANDLLP